MTRIVALGAGRMGRGIGHVFAYAGYRVDILDFKARTADDVDNFLNELEAFRVAIGSPGVRNRYPYRISLARDLLGLSDENLNPDGELTPNHGRAAINLG